MCTTLTDNWTNLDRHQKAIKDSHAEKKRLGRESELFIKVGNPRDDTTPKLWKVGIHLYQLI